MEREDEGKYLCKAVQNVVGEDETIKYSDFKDLVINLKIERKTFFRIKKNTYCNFFFDTQSPSNGWMTRLEDSSMVM